MSLTIGIVCEGPSDYDLLRTVIDGIARDEDVFYHRLQPVDSLIDPLGNGWKGVWRWCEEYGGKLTQYFSEISPQIQYLIVQMDGDVSRKEREPHCACPPVVCPSAGEVHPLTCELCASERCPVALPCAAHEAAPSGYREHLEKLVFQWLRQSPDHPAILVTIPCDSTDAWIAAAYEGESCDYEQVEDPWRSIIAHSASYHGIRIPGRKKRQQTYAKLAERVCEEWDTVKERCVEAARFDRAIRCLCARESGKKSERNGKLPPAPQP